MSSPIIAKQSQALAHTLQEARACRVCEAHLPLGPRPVIAADSRARLLIIGQAPGTRVHASGVPWNDPSGDRLRDWMGLGRDIFYDASEIAIVPMGLCYPGKGKSGDLPPRPECAPLWHQRVFSCLPNIQLTLLVGQYAQVFYLGKGYKTLTERVRAWREFGPAIMPLVHPSPRNRRWLGNNPWFEAALVPELRRRVGEVLLHQ